MESEIMTCPVDEEKPKRPPRFGCLHRCWKAMQRWCCFRTTPPTPRRQTAPTVLPPSLRPQTAPTVPTPSSSKPQTAPTVPTPLSSRPQPPPKPSRPQTLRPVIPCSHCLGLPASTRPQTLRPTSSLQMPPGYYLGLPVSTRSQTLRPTSTLQLPPGHYELMPESTRIQTLKFPPDNVARTCRCGVCCLYPPPLYVVTMEDLVRFRKETIEFCRRPPSLPEEVQNQEIYV